ncbi:hypothetical protein HPB47_028270 [Ixodes persulcatus]|uniref:Uncharacterized protein n=1 Tax=Ixodes persulcatus TaxID=34615 RepID=A0AC60PTP5_IXOPE|nr:hypothetical protein HPB47_028270 [Ixodes persulcatus]
MLRVLTITSRAGKIPAATDFSRSPVERKAASFPSLFVFVGAGAEREAWESVGVRRQGIDRADSKTRKSDEGKTRPSDPTDARSKQ